MPPKPPPPKPAPKPPAVAYVFDLIIHKLLVDPIVADYDQILITIKIGDEVSFNVTANRIDGVFQKVKTSHEIKLTTEKLQEVMGLPVEVYFKKAPTEEEQNNAKQNIDKNETEKNAKTSESNKKKNPDEKKINSDEKKNKEEPKPEDDNFGDLVIIWQPIVLNRITANKFSTHTQFEDKDILKPIIKPVEEIPEPGKTDGKKPEEKKQDEEPEEVEEEPREIIGCISMLIKFQVKPVTPDRGTLADKDGILNVADEIESKIDPNDTIFVIGNDEQSKYEKFLTNCNDNQCPVRIDINKYRSIHGRLINSPLVISPCGNLDCCNECGTKEDEYCDKVISELEAIRIKNFCYKKRR